MRIIDKLESVDTSVERWCLHGQIDIINRLPENTHYPLTDLKYLESNGRSVSVILNEPAQFQICQLSTSFPYLEVLLSVHVKPGHHSLPTTAA